MSNSSETVSTIQGWLIVAAATVGIITFGLWDNGIIGGNDEPYAPIEIVHNSAWNGSVRQVDDWFKQNLNDYESLQVVEWSQVVKGKGGYLVRVKFRAKNQLGGYVLAHKLFTLDFNGNVTSVTDWIEN